MLVLLMMMIHNNTYNIPFRPIREYGIFFLYIKLFNVVYIENNSPSLSRTKVKQHLLLLFFIYQDVSKKRTNAKEIIYNPGYRRLCTILHYLWQTLYTVFVNVWLQDNRV